MRWPWLLMSVSLVAACRPKANVGEKTVPELAQLLATRTAVAVDANDADFRAKNGHIPGAVLLSSFNKYALSELPSNKDTELVFYCSNRF